MCRYLQLYPWTHGKRYLSIVSEWVKQTRYAMHILKLKRTQLHAVVFCGTGRKELRSCKLCLLFHRLRYMTGFGCSICLDIAPSLGEGEIPPKLNAQTVTEMRECVQLTFTEKNQVYTDIPTTRNHGNDEITI